MNNSLILYIICHDLLKVWNERFYLPRTTVVWLSERTHCWLPTGFIDFFQLHWTPPLSLWLCRVSLEISASLRQQTHVHVHTHGGTDRHKPIGLTSPSVTYSGVVQGYATLPFLAVCAFYAKRFHCNLSVVMFLGHPFTITEPIVSLLLIKFVESGEDS